MCESLLFSNLFHGFILVLLEHKQKDKSVGVIYHGFYPLLAMVYECFRVYCMGRYVLENFCDFGAIWSLLSAELQRCVRCLNTDGDLPTVQLSPSLNTR